MIDNLNKKIINKNRLANSTLLLFVVLIQLLFFFNNKLFFVIISSFIDTSDVNYNNISFTDFLADLSLPIFIFLLFLCISFDSFIIYKVIKNKPVLNQEYFKNKRNEKIIFWLLAICLFLFFGWLLYRVLNNNF